MYISDWDRCHGNGHNLFPSSFSKYPVLVIPFPHTQHVYSLNFPTSFFLYFLQYLQHVCIYVAFTQNRDEYHVCVCVCVCWVYFTRRWKQTLRSVLRYWNRWLGCHFTQALRVYYATLEAKWLLEPETSSVLPCIRAPKRPYQLWWPELFQTSSCTRRVSLLLRATPMYKRRRSYPTIKSLEHIRCVIYIYELVGL